MIFTLISEIIGYIYYVKLVTKVASHLNDLMFRLLSLTVSYFKHFTVDIQQVIWTMSITRD